MAHKTPKIDIYTIPIKFFHGDMLSGSMSKVNDKFQAEFFNEPQTFRVTEKFAGGCFAVLEKI